MVAVVAGNGLGLFNSSLNTLGAAAASPGQGTLGQAGGQAWVNGSTGNLILRFTDEQLSGLGQDLLHTRMYNAQGGLTDGDADGWRWDGERQVALQGLAFTEGSRIIRTTGDGHQAVYAWNGVHYQSSEGDGAHDFIVWDNSGYWAWIDGSRRTTERYAGDTGRLTSVVDAQGTQIYYSYTADRLTSVRDVSGAELVLTYNTAGKLSRLDTRVAASEAPIRQVYYTYDDLGRLTLVQTDLTPDDHQVSDGNVYGTAYTYDGASFRIASINQSDGTAAYFTYQLVLGEYRVESVTDQFGTTTFSYDTVHHSTSVSNAFGQVWKYFYGSSDQLLYTQSPALEGGSIYTSYSYDAEGNVTRIADSQGSGVSYFYDANGNRIMEVDPQGTTLSRVFSATNQVLNEIHYSAAATWNATTSSWNEPSAASAQVTRYVYDYADRLRFVVSGTGTVSEYRYNGNGMRGEEIVYGDGTYWVVGLAPRASLDEASLAIWAGGRDRSRSQMTALNYDFRGNLSQRVVFASVDSYGNGIVDAGTDFTEYVYSAHGQLLHTIARRGPGRGLQYLLSSTTYDGLGRIIGQLDAKGSRTTIYSGNTRNITVISASGLIVTQTYDALGRVISIVETEVNVASRGTSLFYDAVGRLVMKEDPTGARTYTFYDVLGRVSGEVDGAGALTRYSYNHKGLRVEEMRYSTQVLTGGWFNGARITVTLEDIQPAFTTADRRLQYFYDSADRLIKSTDGVATITNYEYDGRGQLIRQQTGERSTRIFYDADGRQTGQLDAEGYLRENVYNAAGQLAQVIRYAAATDPQLRYGSGLAQLRPASAQQSTWFFYDSVGRQIGSVDEQQFVSETIYDEAGNVRQEVRYATRHTAAININSSFAAIRGAVIGGGSQITTTKYDQFGRVAWRSAPDGSVSILDYDAAGRVVSETTAAGTLEARTIRTRYDAFGQTIGKLLGEASGRITAGMSEAQVAAVYSEYGLTWRYDAAGRVASVTDAMGNRTLSWYDTGGRLTRVINAMGEVSETRYNVFGDVVERNQLNNRLSAGALAALSGGPDSVALDNLLAAIRSTIDSHTYLNYDTRGLVATTIDAEGYATSSFYDQYGQLQRQVRTISSSQAVTTWFEHNLRGEQTRSISDAVFNVTKTAQYDAYGRVVRAVDGAGGVTTTEYLDGGRVIVVRDALNSTRRTEYDAYSRVLKEVDELNNVTLHGYDDAHRYAVVTLPDGTRISTWKNRHGETLSVVNGKGEATLHEYNREGQVTKVTNGVGQVTSANYYDQAGRLSESVDALGTVTHLDYDAASRVLVRTVDPTRLALRTTYQFDTSGRQLWVVENAGTSSARTTEYRYDRKGQLTHTILDPGGLQLSTRYAHDGLGNVLGVYQGTFTESHLRVTEYVFDNLGRRIEERSDPYGLNLRTRYEYDNANRVTRKLDANGGATDYVYDALGRQRFTVDPMGYVTGRTYDAAGNVTQETRYATAFQGLRDRATLQGLVTNRLVNVAFDNPGVDSAPAGWSLGRNVDLPVVLGGNAAYLQDLIPQDLPAGDSVSWIYQVERDQQNRGAYQQLTQDIPEVTAGHRYAFSVYTAVQQTTAYAQIAWFGADGKMISETNVDGASQNLNEAVGGQRLADYKRIVAEGVAPEGAVRAVVVIRKNNTIAGQTGSRMIAVHAQFEELALDASGAGTWARSMTTSAEDRVTSYAYDALGRQRVSVDALGYVTERSYDAAGNVTGETRYATRLEGRRDTASLQRLVTNQLVNVAFDHPSADGVPAGWALGRSADLPVIMGGNASFLQDLIPQDLPAGDSVSWIYQNGRDEQNADAYQELSQAIPDVKAGYRYAFSAYTAVQETTAYVQIAWFDANGVMVGETNVDAASQNLNERFGGQRLADYKRIVAEGVAPEKAVRAVVVIRKANSAAGQQTSRLIAVHPQFEELPVSASGPSQWARPMPKSTEDRVTSYVYDAAGRQRFSIDALGYVTSRSYDAAGNVTQEVRYANKSQAPRNAYVQVTASSEDRRTRYVYDVLGRQRFSVDSLGYVTGRVYNAAGDVTQETRYAQPTESVDIAWLGSNTSANDRTTYYVYDAVGRQRFSIDALGYVAERTYDAVGNVTQEIRYANPHQRLVAGQPEVVPSSYDRVTSYIYDSLNRQRFSIDTLGYVTERAYDASGNVTRETHYADKLQDPRDPLLQLTAGPGDRTRRSTYDALGRLTTATDPAGYQEAYTYDAFGNRTSLINKNGHVWYYRYDRSGQLLEEITPQIWVSKLDAAGGGTGAAASLVTRFEYDGLGNVISRSEGRLRSSPGSDPALDDVSSVRTTTYGYDTLGHQVRITTPGWYNKTTGQYQMAGDGSANTFQVTTEVTYDGLGNAVRNRVRVNNSGDAAIDFVDSFKAYDQLGQVRYEVDALRGVSSSDYDGFGSVVLTRRYSTALNTGIPAIGYYSVGFLDAGMPLDPGNDRSILTRYDHLGRKTEVQQNFVSLYAFTGNVATSSLLNVAPTTVYSYNSFGQVIRETLEARVANGASAMDRIKTVNYYDRAGQRVGTVDTLGYYTRMEYDANGQVSRQVEYATALAAWSDNVIPTAPASAQDRSLRFSYDAAGRLIQTAQENVSYWQQFFVGGSIVTSRVTGDVLVSRSGYDAVGNVRTLVDAAGNLTRTEYNALGQVVKVTEPRRSIDSAGVRNLGTGVEVFASPTTTYGVNAFGQVLFEYRSAEGDTHGARVTATLYDAAGHAIREIDAAGSAQYFKVDVAGRRLQEERWVYSIADNLSYNHVIRRTYSYDNLGQQISTSDWYSSGGELKSTVNAVTYNRFGEVTSELLNGHLKASYGYNMIGQAIRQTNAEGVTLVDYDLTGKASRSAQVGASGDSSGARITYTLNDLLGRAVAQHLPGFTANTSADTLNVTALSQVTPVISQTSDRWGNVLSRTDARNYVTTYRYDHNNQQISETLPATDILREDGTAYRASLIHEKRYDSLGRLVEEADLILPEGAVAGATELRARQHAYNEVGELVRDVDALGYSRYYSVDIHGNRIGTSDPLGIVLIDEYDAMDRLVRHGVMRNGQKVILLTNQYDQAGRLYAEIDGAARIVDNLTSTRNSDGSSTIAGQGGNTRFTVFDERGNIVQTRSESNIDKYFGYSETNRKVAEADGLGNTQTWTYNEGDYGRLLQRKDLSGRVFFYGYNQFGQVLSENSDRFYTYYANGLLRSITTNAGYAEGVPYNGGVSINSWQSGKTATYSYDASGNRVGDALFSAYQLKGSYSAVSKEYYQETRLRFNEVGNLSAVYSPKGSVAYDTPSIVDNDVILKSSTTLAMTLTYSFDEFGNRRKVSLDTSTQLNKPLNITDWYKYDRSDRVTIAEGFSSGGQVVAGVVGGKAKGYTISYDVAGRRLSSEQWAAKSGSNERYERSDYTYNDLNQITGRSVTQLIRGSGANSSGAVTGGGATQRSIENIYDARGRVEAQYTYKDGLHSSAQTFTYRGDGQKYAELSYTYVNGQSRVTQRSYFGDYGMVDAAGNQTLYRYAVYSTDGRLTSEGDYRTTYIGFDSYKANILTTSASGMNPSTTTHIYSERGDLLYVSGNGSVFRRYATNGDGQIIARLENNGSSQNYLYYQNSALANAGSISAAAITDTFVPISADYPGNAPSSYIVNQGDTLEKVAQALWGDSRMWYLIADANGLGNTDKLITGSSLKIPNVVSSTHNTATTFKPYNPNEVIGDTALAPQPPKPKKKKCNAVAAVVMVVVAVVVTIFTAGAGAAYFGTAAASFADAMVIGANAVMAGGISVGGVAGIAAYAGGAVVGSLASQAVGKSMGVVDKISWKQAAVAGLGGGIAAGLTGLAAGANSTLGNALNAVKDSNATWGQIGIAYSAQGVAGYMGSYVASKVVGLETSFSWKNMAASAASSVVAGFVNTNSGWGASMIRGQVSGHASAWMKDKWFGGDRPDYGQVAADAFGNALVDYMVHSLQKDHEKELASEQRAREDNVTFRERYDSEILLASTGWMPPRERDSRAPMLVAPTFIGDEPEPSKYDKPSSVDLNSISVGAQPDLDASGVLDKASAFMKDARAIDKIYLDSVVRGSQGGLGEVIGRARRALNTVGYDTVDTIIAVGQLATSAQARAEMMEGISALAGYVIDNPREAAQAVAGATNKYMNETSPAQMAEDAFRVLVSGGVANGGIKILRKAVGEAAWYAKHSVYVSASNSATLYGGIFIPALGKRITTVTKAMSLRFQNDGYLDPFTNKIKYPAPGEVLAVDHKFPVKEIIGLPGFEQLTKSQMIDIIQDRVNLGNLQAMPINLNSSKGSSLDWEKVGDRYLDPVYRRNLIVEQQILRVKITNQIEAFLELNRSRR